MRLAVDGAHIGRGLPDTQSSILPRARPPPTKAVCDSGTWVEVAVLGARPTLLTLPLAASVRVWRTSTRIILGRSPSISGQSLLPLGQSGPLTRPSPLRKDR